MNRRFGKALVVNPGRAGQRKDGYTGRRTQFGRWTIAPRCATYEVEKTIWARAGTPLDSTDVAVLTHVLRTGGELASKKQIATGL
jgi:hypothetical protein